MTRSVKELWYWASGLLFLLVLLLILTNFIGYYFQFIAVIAVAGCGILFYMAGIIRSFHLLLLSLPLSFNLPFTPENQIMFPSELVVAAFGIAVILHWVSNSSGFTEWFKQPLTVAIFSFLFFLFISVFFSEMIIVSIKSVIIKSLYIISFYGGGYIYFKEVKDDRKFIHFYLLPFLIVVLIVMIRHADFSFSKEVSGYVTKPFYNDHTIYSTVLAFIVPFLIAFARKGKGFKRFAYVVILLMLSTALVLAASRAAWLSLIIALLLGSLILIRFPRKWIASIFILSTLVLFLKSDDLLWKLKSNRFDSSARNAGIEEQTKSVANITNDQSNAERINRWKCAWRMFLVRPLTGFGPGTYQFSYFPFQRENELTRISVKSPYNIADGRGGTAHNEFLLILAESGVITALLFVLIVIMTIIKGFNACYKFDYDFIALATLVAFISFIIHSLFNNFLDTDKTAALFYIAIAFFASLNLSGTKNIGYER